MSSEEAKLPETTTVLKPSGKIKITPFEKRKMVSLWEIGGRTQQEIADIYGVSVSRISQILSEMKAGKKGSKIEDAIAGVLRDEMKTEASRVLEKIREFKGSTEKYIDLLMRLTMREVANAQNEHVGIGTKERNLKALRYALVNIQTGRKEFWELHGLDKDEINDDELPELGIGIYSEADMEEINLQKEREAKGGLTEEEMGELLAEVEEIAAAADGTIPASDDDESAGD